MRFTYTAVDPSGKAIRDMVEAVTLREGIRMVRGQGLLVTDIQPFIEKASVGQRLRKRFARVRLLDVVLLARHLALFLRAGVTIDRAFEILVGQARTRGIRAVLTEVLESIRRGEALASALARHPNVFPERFVAMVQWGEAGGKLSDSLEHLATQLERDRELQSKVRGAMVYPLIVVGAVVLIGTLMAVFVLPQLVEIIESFDVELPLATQIFLSIVRFVLEDGILLLPVLLFGLVLLVPLFRSPRFRPVLHRTFLRLPLIGRIVRMVNLARLNRSFGSLIQSGIPILETLVIVRGVLGNVIYQQALGNVVEDVRQGQGLGRSLKKYGTLFPLIETDMIVIGEETGKLDEVLLYLGDFYEDTVNQLMKNLAQTVEPVLLLIVGTVVAGVVLAVILPIYQISEAIV